MQTISSGPPVARPAALIRDMAAFIRRPRVYQGDENALGAGQRVMRTVRVWALLFSLLLPFMCLIVLVVMAFGMMSQRMNGGIPGDPTSGFDSQNALADLLAVGNPLLVFFLAVIQAPLLEETAFRLWLKPTRRNLSLGLGAFLFFMFSFARNLFSSTRAATEASMSLKATLLNLAFAIAVIAVAALVLWFVFSGRRLAWVQNFYARHFWLPFAASALVFGGIHITNYTNPLLWLAAPVLVFPQFLLGFGLGYARARFGFGYGILMHTLHNGLLFIPGVLSLQMAKVSSSASTQNTLGILISSFVAAYCGGLLLLMVFNAVWSVAELRSPAAPAAG